jgi:hypothetical protein
VISVSGNSVSHFPPRALRAGRRYFRLLNKAPTMDETGQQLQHASDCRTLHGRYRVSVIVRNTNNERK